MKPEILTWVNLFWLMWEKIVLNKLTCFFNRCVELLGGYKTDDEKNEHIKISCINHGHMWPQFDQFWESRCIRYFTVFLQSYVTSCHNCNLHACYKCCYDHIPLALKLMNLAYGYIDNIHKIIILHTFHCWLS